jgi:DNA polymerase-1
VFPINIGSESEEITNCSVEFILDYFSDVNESIAVDTETAGRDPHVKGIISLQLGTPDDQFIIDCRDINILLFKELLENRLLLLHNSKFDYKFLKANGITVENIYDTMLAECVLYCGYQKYGYGLKDLCKRYVGFEMSKEVRGEFFMLGDRPFSNSQIIYAATDVKYLHNIRELQLERARKEDLLYTINLENQAVKALADIEYNGMYLNSKQWLNNTFKYEEELDVLTVELDKLVLADPILSKKIVHNEQLDLFSTNVRLTKLNYSSPLQMLKLLRFLGFDVEDSSDRTLSKLKHPFVTQLQKYRELSTIVNRYGRNFINYINKNTGRVHTDFWQVLNTGRISSGSDEMNAPNLQNIPADNSFRNCFEAREGFVWLSVDYSSQELRLMADGSGESAFIDCINRDEDLHCYAGSMMFKRTITKADKELRNKAKTINFGSKRL